MINRLLAGCAIAAWSRLAYYLSLDYMNPIITAVAILGTMVYAFLKWKSCEFKDEFDKSLPGLLLWLFIGGLVGLIGSMLGQLFFDSFIGLWL